jgi:hypothetical protein
VFYYFLSFIYLFFLNKYILVNNHYCFNRWLYCYIKSKLK